eukprot:CAMPEP_0182905404 /NCGR_PEP_ID=MMETSP0034_2-20130328/32924_1 /TAXON_ID=156128 /ORGANISM="Nephroselmis pyriformis, Strain CCMP717" /LENGTH=219 /DNA_ID=CAMNT_0025040813 /DNA_START=26 /DNA_END=682 /DNA_ORIENTATION=+
MPAAASRKRACIARGMPSRTSEQAAGRCSPHPLPCESSPTPLRSQQGGPPELSCPTHAAPPGATFNFRKAGLIIPVCVFTTGRFESSPASNSRSPHLAWRLASSRMQSLSRHSTPGERFHFPSRRREARSIASPKPLSPPPSRFDHLDNLRASLRAGESTSQAAGEGLLLPLEAAAEEHHQAREDVVLHPLVPCGALHAAVHPPRPETCQLPLHPLDLP